MRHIRFLGLTAAVVLLGCNKSGSGSGEVLPNPDDPEVSIVSNLTTGKAPVEVQFSAVVTKAESPIEYMWDFGDGTTGTGQMASHRYEVGGQFKASLTITDALGKKASSIKDLTIETNPRYLFVELVNGSIVGQIPSDVTLRATVAGGEAVTLQWNFMDGSAAITQELVPGMENSAGLYVVDQPHTLATVGNYAVSVQVTGSEGISTYSVPLRAISGTRPVFTLTADPTTGTGPTRVTFHTEITDGGPASYLFDFGDGSQALGPINPNITSFDVSHTYYGSAQDLNACEYEFDYDEQTSPGCVIIGVGIGAGGGGNGGGGWQ